MVAFAAVVPLEVHMRCQQLQERHLAWSLFVVTAFRSQATRVQFGPVLSKLWNFVRGRCPLKPQAIMLAARVHGDNHMPQGQLVPPAVDLPRVRLALATTYSVVVLWLASPKQRGSLVYASHGLRRQGQHHAGHRHRSHRLRNRHRSITGWETRRRTMEGR